MIDGRTWEVQTGIVGAMLLLTLTAVAHGQVDSTAPRPLSLREALARAESASEAVGLAEAGVQRSRGQQFQAKSGYYPQLSGSATYTRTIRSQFSALDVDDPNGS